jgi:two-component system, cell cycle sensor histidine kinase and response regulator CckA
MTEKPTYEELERRVQELKTDYTQLENKLLEARSLTEEIMMYMTEGLVLTDTDEIVIFINQRLSEMLGYLSEEIIGKCWLDMVPVEQQAIANEAKARRAHGFIDRYEIVLRRKNGEKFSVLIGAGPRFDMQSGKYLGSMAVVNDITKRKQAEEMLKAGEAAVRNKLKAIIEPESDLGELELGDIIDIPAVQSLMENFHRITGMSSAIVDSNGKVLVNVGWQDICTKFHRCHPEAQKNCVASDTVLAHATEPGRFKSYRCKNGMWDMSSPIVVSGLLMGNIYFGQFIYSDEELDVERFRNQARRYGFEEVEYLAALNRVPRYDRETVEEVMAFYSKLGAMISALSYSNVRLSRTLTEQKRAEEALRRNEKDLRESQRIAHVGSWRLDVATNQVVWTEELYHMYGFDPSLPPPPYTEHMKLFTPESWERLSTALARTRDTGIPYTLELETVRKDGSNGWMWVRGEADVDSAGKTVELWGAAQDITERKQAEKALAQKSKLLEDSQTLAKLGSWEWDIVHDKWYFSDHWKKIHGVSADYLDTIKLIEIAHPEDAPYILKAFADAKEQGKPYDIEHRIIRADNKEIRYIKALGELEFDQDIGVRMVGTAQDITTFKQSEAEREKLREQLNQAQKMESVGRLAGGIAHDFNNMLGVILGHTEMALEETDPASPLYADLHSVHQAAERSAALTRQLLAFARKQTVAPKVIDLNETVEGMLKMLRQLIGEEIDLLWQPGKNLQPVKVDPAQIDQLLANLCVNARDAIVGVGKITIETDTKIFDEDYCTSHLGSLPGEYVLLEVSDDGCGMDKKTLSQIFEPFFTTKEQGKGTGLGLASVFGMVKQNNGFINVYSEPGQGTTFKIYLPVYAVKSDEMVEKSPSLPAEHGNETILLVEDETAILEMTTRMLERLGYTVVAATTPGEAIRLAHEYQGRIDLLMTDVVMPEMNGRELAGNLLSHYPDLKRLFMSGYTANVIAHHGVLDQGVHFIQKPFSKKDLGEKLREALEG